MGTDSGPGVVELSPVECWDRLSATEDAVLVDVRTRPEWAFVGVPDVEALARKLVLSEWRRYPDMSVNTGFAEALRNELGGTLPSELLFICRSGARSLEAARAVAAEAAERGERITCINVAEGFEGDLDGTRHRGATNGWKARGLPWRQS